MARIRPYGCAIFSGFFLVCLVGAGIGAWEYYQYTSIKTSSGFRLAESVKGSPLSVSDPLVGELNSLLQNSIKIYRSETEDNVAESALHLWEYSKAYSELSISDALKSLIRLPAKSSLNAAQAIEYEYEWHRSQQARREGFDDRLRSALANNMPVQTWMPGEGCPLCGMNLLGDTIREIALADSQKRSRSKTKGDPLALCEACALDYRWFGDKYMIQSLNSPYDIRCAWNEITGQFTLWGLDRTKQQIQYWTTDDIREREQFMRNRARAISGELDARDQRYYPLAENTLTSEDVRDYYGQYEGYDYYQPQDTYPQNQTYKLGPQPVKRHIYVPKRK